MGNYNKRYKAAWDKLRSIDPETIDRYRDEMLRPKDFRYWTDETSGLRYRQGVVDDAIVVDRELTSTGFSGTQGTDWERLSELKNEYQITKPTTIPNLFSDGYREGFCQVFKNSKVIWVNSGKALDYTNKVLIKMPYMKLIDIRVSGLGGIQNGNVIQGDWYAIFVVADEDGNNVDVMAVNADERLNNPKSVARRVGWVKVRSTEDSWVYFTNTIEGQYFFHSTIASAITDTESENWSEMELRKTVPVTASHAYVYINAKGDGTTNVYGIAVAPIQLRAGVPLAENYINYNKGSAELGESVVGSTVKVPISKHRSFRFIGKGAYSNLTDKDVVGWEDVIYKENNIWANHVWRPNSYGGDIRGAVTVSAPYDIDGNGKTELVHNIAAQSRFVSAKRDGTRTEYFTNVNWNKGRQAYWPKLVKGDIIGSDTLFFANRADNSIIALNPVDGSVVWEISKTDIMATEMTDIGLLYGCKGDNNDEVGVLNYSDGSSYSANWPITFGQHASGLSAGDLNGDGNDEFVLASAGGKVEVRDRNANLLHTPSDLDSDWGGHIDFAIIEDFDGDGNNELLICMGDTGDVGSEGDTLYLIAHDGDLKNTFKLPSSGPMVGVANFYPEYEGLEIVYNIEGGGEIGMLKGDLTEKIWSKMPEIEGSGGYVTFGDVNGDGYDEFIIPTGLSPLDGFILYDRKGNLLETGTEMGWGRVRNHFVRNGSKDINRFYTINGIDYIYSAILPTNELDSGIDGIYELTYRPEW